MAQPKAPIVGIKYILLKTEIITPSKAEKLRLLRKPPAVNKVPKIKLKLIAANANIK